MISKDTFVKAISSIEELNKKNDDAYTALEALGIEVSIIVNPLEELVIDLLKESLNDQYEWIEWFVYENDFGNRNMKCTSKEGYTIKTDTAEDIYDLITGNPTLLVKEDDKCHCRCSKESY
jgi:hypothetical protein